MDLSHLNSQQRKAVEAGDGPVLIIAGPGTGKTKTLTARIAYLLRIKQIPPADIVALTFTKKAAREMQERLRALLDAGSPLPSVTTFHALGHDLLRRYGPHRQLIDEPARLEIIRSLARPAVFKGQSTRKLGLIISRAKNALETPTDEPVRHLLDSYEAVLTRQKVYDFDDLLRQTYRALQNNPDQRPGYRFILIDEFQDTNELQYELLRLLGAQNNIFAIGDPNQSIYAFRGAGAEMFERFQKDFPEVQEVGLTTNYRSRPEVIMLANAIFPAAPQLVAAQRQTGAGQTIQTLNAYSEAAYVIGEIEHGIGGSDFLKAHADDPAHQPRDYAVLYRTHRAARTLQKALAESGLPYQVAGEGSPYNTPEIQTLIAYLRYVHDPGQIPAALQKETAHLRALAGATDRLNVCDRATKLAESLGLRIDGDLRQLLGTLIQFGYDNAAALKHLDDISENEFYDPTVNAVTLLTIHASKGLEFEHVFLCAAEEGILPKTSPGRDEDINEERRLFYVAVTRAKGVLDILWAKNRDGRPAVASRFAAALPDTVLPHSVDPSMENLERQLRKRRQKRAQTSLF